jgi:hypothetical protein
MSTQLQLQIPLVTELERLSLLHVVDNHRTLAMEELREVVGSPACPFKDVVYDCDIPKSSLSMALSPNDTHGHDFPLRVFFYAAHRARTDRLAEIVASLRDRDLCPRKISTEQRLAKLEAAVRRAGTAGLAIFADAGLR